MAAFDFATSSRIIFGRGSSKRLLEVLQNPRSVCVLTGAASTRSADVLAALAGHGIRYHRIVVSGEPDTTAAEQAVAEARRLEADTVVSIGGGSVIDCGKVVAALLRNDGALSRYLEVVGAGAPLVHRSAPHIVLPTTAGSGTEATRNAVLKVREHGVKVSMRGQYLLPSTAIVDPQLSAAMPKDLTAATGMDALTQLFEAFVSNKANPVTDALCREGLRRAAQALPRAYSDGNDESAREEMALAALFSGIALANAGLGAVHGLAGVIGGKFEAPHGAVCARLLPFVAGANLHGIKERHPLSPALERFKEAASLLTDRSADDPRTVIDVFDTLSRTLRIPSLASYGVAKRDLPEIAAQSMKASSMKGNPIELHREELEEILALAL